MEDPQSLCEAMLEALQCASNYLELVWQVEGYGYSRGARGSVMLVVVLMVGVIALVGRAMGMTAVALVWGRWRGKDCGYHRHSEGDFGVCYIGALKVSCHGLLKAVHCQGGERKAKAG